MKVESIRVCFQGDDQHVVDRILGQIQILRDLKPKITVQVCDLGIFDKLWPDNPDVDIGEPYGPRIPTPTACTMPGRIVVYGAAAVTMRIEELLK